MSIIQPGVLYIVATPIGNLDDITLRARDILSEVDAIAAEDTRHSRSLLNHLGINTPLFAVHDHNEEQKSQSIIERLQRGESIALISDAGTPLISDPGYRLVRAAHQAGQQVCPIPGASAMVTALSVCGLATDRFCFEGFLSAKSGTRRDQLKKLTDESRTLIFYESSHRVVATLIDMVEIFGREREATLARELTKKFETIKQSTLSDLQEFVAGDANQQKGEFVLLIAGEKAEQVGTLDSESRRIVELLGNELPVKQASKLAAEITGRKKRELYQHLLGREK
ncbi:MAG: 16S rRNA (cytidine(1402)-2'-O)-methyltransferase [Chromatiales bacterium]|nr:16S rRNA (cytidine(1402)-2'-O)-methyltransferase [Chromatiales bacterium]